MLLLPLVGVSARADRLVGGKPGARFAVAAEDLG